MLSSRGVGCKFDIIGACGGNECLWERISNKTLWEIFRLENVVLEASLHGMLLLRGS
jgi:hypothetical protein